jgi:hypothetical protein
MNTLSNVEAERVSQILRSTIERLSLMKCVPQKKDDALLDIVPAPKVSTGTVLALCCWCTLDSLTASGAL